MARFGRGQTFNPGGWWYRYIRPAPIYIVQAGIATGYATIPPKPTAMRGDGIGVAHDAVPTAVLTVPNAAAAGAAFRPQLNLTVIAGLATGVGAARDPQAPIQWSSLGDDIIWVSGETLNWTSL